MGKARDKNELMHQKSLPEKRYANYESTKVRKEVVMG
jgi:hypothetical protein